MTNYERLKAMSLEEMAQALMGEEEEHSPVEVAACRAECIAHTGDDGLCPYIGLEGLFSLKKRQLCYKCMEKWLRMEVSDENKA